MYMLQIGPNECTNGLETIYFEWYEQLFEGNNEIN